MSNRRKYGKVPVPFSQSQLKRLFGCMDNAKVALVCFLAMRTGMRLNEVLGTKISEIEWELQRICKPITKGGKPRTYFVDKKVLSILRKWVGLLGDTEYLFPSACRSKERMRNEGFYNMYRQYLKKSGLWIVDANRRKKNGLQQHVFTFHSFRTTFCSFLINAGCPIYTAKELMGHTKVSVTERYYTYLGDTTMKHEMDKVFGRGKNGFLKREARGNADVDSFVSRVDDAVVVEKPSVDPLYKLQLLLVDGKISIEEFEKKSRAILETRKLLTMAVTPTPGSAN